MEERRRRRSTDRSTALRYLLESLAERSEVEAVTLLDARGNVLSSVGDAARLDVLARLAPRVAKGQRVGEMNAATIGTDYFVHRIETDSSVAILAAIGTRLRRFPDAVRAVRRIGLPV